MIPGYERNIITTGTRLAQHRSRCVICSLLKRSKRLHGATEGLGDLKRTGAEVLP